nr:N-6 DNA methylase [Candidatus Njordarchaeum guaymaensis]
MGAAREVIEARVPSLLGANDVEDPKEAFEAVITALATISSALHCSRLRTVLSSTGFPQISPLKRLPSNELEFLDREVKAKETSLSENDIYDNQVSVQKLISSPRRKRLAAYYTKATGLELMSQVASHFVETRGTPVVLADPFLGSGLTLTETLKKLDHSMVRKVWGVEPHPLSALVAYSALLYVLKGDQRKIGVIVGDTFKNIYGDLKGSSTSPKEGAGSVPSADIMITNPPFTRWELLGEDYRNFLRTLVEKFGYSRYVTRKQLNLQLASLFMMDYLLERDGLLLSVLPASTFYTIYGEAAKSMLREKYRLNAFVENGSDTSFSSHSGFKEVILVATKEEKAPRNEVAFITMEAGSNRHIQQLKEAMNGHKLEEDKISWIDLAKKPPLWETNWLVFFGKNELREILGKVLSLVENNGTMGTWVDVLGKESIVRGVEMYGPDFFLIPNRYWNIVEEAAHTVVVENAEEGLRLEIPKEYLVPTLRKPELYYDTIKPRATHRFLSIPRKPVGELPGALVDYMKWGKRSRTAQTAMRALGGKWYSHVHKQLNVKKPFGGVFLPDKIDPSFRNRGVFACYSQTPLAASKNFHIVSLNDSIKEKALVAWFNSTLFIAYFTLANRRISKNWARLLIDDYLRMPIVNVNALSRRTLSELEKSVNDLSEEKLPPVKLQLDLDYRLSIDRTLLDAIGVSEPETLLKRLYSTLDLG